MKNSIIALIAVLGAVGCDARSARPQAASATPQTISAEIVIAPQHGGDKVSVADGMVNLTFKWTGSKPGDLQRLEIYSPEGTLHGTSATAIDPSGNVLHELQISGTAIADYNMLGTWKVRVSRNDDGVVVRERSFDIVP